MDTEKRQPAPIEVWLSKQNIKVTCTVVREDETTRSVDVDSLSMRGAQREMTGWLIGWGYSPVSRWGVEGEDGEGNVIESMRQFKPGADAQAV